MVTEIQLAGYFLLVWIGNLWENVYRTFSQMTQQLPANTAWCINHSWCLVLFRFVRLKQASLNCIVRYPYRRGILSANFHINKNVHRKWVTIIHRNGPFRQQVFLLCKSKAKLMIGKCLFITTNKSFARVIKHTNGKDHVFDVLTKSTRRLHWGK